MDYIWFSRSRTAGGPPPTWFRSGSVGFDVNGSNVFITAFSFATGYPQVRRAAYTNNNYLSFSQLNVSGINPDNEAQIPLVNDPATGGTLLFIDSESNPFYQNVAGTPTLINIGYVFTENLSTSTPLLNLTHQLPDVQTIYPAGGGGGVPLAYTGSVMVGTWKPYTPPSPTSTFVAPYAQVSENQITTGTDTGNYVTPRNHVVKIDNTSKSISWVRSGYPTGIQLAQSPGTPRGYGRKVYPLDMRVDSMPAPFNYVTPSSSPFLGRQAVVGNFVFFEKGCVRSLANITINNGGSGATQSAGAGLNVNFTGYLFINPTPDPTGGRNTLPIVVKATVTSGVVSAITEIVCHGSGFPNGTNIYEMTWDTNNDKYNTIVASTTASSTVTYTQTTKPKLSITISDAHAPLRHITMKDPGDGYYWDGTDWNGVATKQATFSPTSRDYPTQATPGTVTWSSPSTSETGTLYATQMVYGGVNWQPPDVNVYAVTSTSPASISGGTVVPVNPASSLLLVRCNNAGSMGLTFNSNYPAFPYWGPTYWAEDKVPSAWPIYAGQMMFSNDDLQTIQYVNMPNLKYQPQVPYAWGNTAITTAGRLLYSSVPSTDPFITFDSAWPTGVGNNLYVFVRHSWGSLNSYSSRMLLYHFNPGGNLNDINSGMAWTYMADLGGPTSPVLIPVFPSGQTFSNGWVQMSSNANWRTNTAPTEAFVTFNTPDRFIAPSNALSLITTSLRLTFTNETTVTSAAAPASLTWAPNSQPRHMQYDVINNRYVTYFEQQAFSKYAAWTGPTPTPSVVLLGVGQSLLATNPTVTILTETQLGNLWEGA